MCGISGIFGFSLESGLAEVTREMVRSTEHRGPDESRTWVDQEAGIALGHNRLSILDLSPLGSQPMHSACGRYVMVYNGEVYNHLSMRPELESAGFRFKGHSDTETILAAIVHWGLSAAVGKFIGMFAFALWDRTEHRLHVVRDRLGIKPVYYGFLGKDFVFGSELKPLRVHPGFDGEIDRGALSLFFRHNYIPAPYSIYKGIRKLEPGRILTVDSSGIQSEETYWSAADIWISGMESPFSGSDDDAVEQLDALLRDSVSMRMLSDVPLGAFLSGGIDSSVVAALMQAQSSAPVKTFSIGFPDDQYNEAPMAARIAAHLGTDHTELYVTPREMMEVIPAIPHYWDEPFADSSQIPTYCLAKLTREHVTVSLSGDGGDELFQGYTRYHMAEQAWRTLQRIPLPIRSALMMATRAVPEKAVRLLGRTASKIHWRLDSLGKQSFRELYKYLLSHHKNPATFVVGGHEPVTALTKRYGDIEESYAEYMSLMDILAYLPDDILTKVDRATMAVSLEARVPLLDHRVVEFAARLPESMKVRGGSGKWPLRKVLERYVPRSLFERPKMGFGVPIEFWLKGELSDWCESLLDYDLIKRQGYVDADEVRRMWSEYKAGQSNWYYYLWDILMFQAWLAENG